MIITANDIKIKGMTLIDKLIQQYGEVFISMRGKKRFVILPLDDYERLKEAEIEKAIREAEEDYKNGRFKVETSEKHFKRLGI